MKLLLRLALSAAMLLLVAGIPAIAQPPQLKWAAALTTTGSVSCSAMAVDSGKNVYVTGPFTGTADFDPGAGTTSLTSDTAFGKGTTYLAKYDAAGALVFALQLGINSRGIAVDKSGNIYLSGYFLGTRDLDPGAATAPLTSAGSTDIFVAKYSPSGSYINAFRIGGTGQDEANAVAVDAAGNVFVTGYFTVTADFDPSSGTTNLTSAAGEDIFLAKYTPAGALSFAFSLHGTPVVTSKDDEGAVLAADAGGNIYLGGRFFGTIDLDPGAGTASFANFGGLDGFIARYDGNGAYLSGFTYDGNIHGLSLDASGNRYVSGTLPDTMDVDPGPGVANLYSVNNFDGWMAKYDAAGNYIHAKAFQSNNVYTPYAIAANNRGNIYVAGRFLDTADFNPGGAGGTFMSHGGTDAFLAKYDAAGGFLFGTSFGGTVADQINCLATDNSGDVWMGGSFSGTFDADFGPGVTNLSSANSTLVIARYADEAAAGIAANNGGQLPVHVYGADNKVIVDFTALDKVDAHVKVLNMLGQTVAEAAHTRADMLRMALPDAASQMYVVVVSNSGATMAQKVWVK